MKKLLLSVYFKSALLLLIVSLVASHTAKAQLDQWVNINEGLGKCTNVGQSGPDGSWERDNYTVRYMVDRRGEMYAWVDYGDNPSTLTDGTTPHPDFNYQNCDGGMFRHDTIKDTWIKVAQDPPSASYDRGIMLTNRSDIFFVTDGRIYILEETGVINNMVWTELTGPPLNSLNYNEAFPTCNAAKLDGKNCSDGVELHAGSHFGQAWGDTLYFFIKASDDSLHLNTVAKFSVTGRNWTFERIGELPWQHMGYNVPIPQQATFLFANNIAGTFKYFVSVERTQDYFRPSFYWVYDPTEPGAFKWKNISEGPRYVNSTGNSCSDALCQACKANPNDPTCQSRENGGSPKNAWWGSGGDGALQISWSGREIYASTQSGIYQWLGKSWRWIADRSRGPVNLAVDGGLFTMSRDNPVQEISFDGTFGIIGGRAPIFSCKHNSNIGLRTPNNGGRLYTSAQLMKDENICDWPGQYRASDELFMIQPDPTKPKNVSNLHLKTGTYLGGNGGGNDVTNLGFGANFNLYVAGTFAGVDVDSAFAKAATYAETNFPWTVGSGRGKIVRYNRFGDTILAAVELGDIIQDFEIQNYGEYRMVVTGDFGVAVLDSNLNEIWHKDLPTIMGPAYLDTADRVQTTPLDVPLPLADIDDDGRVVVGAGRRFVHKWCVIEPDGSARRGMDKTLFLQKLPQFPNIGQEYFSDITIKNDTVYASGYNNGYLNGSLCGSASGFEVQSGWIKCYNYAGADYTSNFMTFGIIDTMLNQDQADTRIYRVNVGKDGKLYAAGEAAGGNSVFRWNGQSSIATNGCSNPQNKLVTTDLYNQPVNTKSAHISYFCTIDPFNGQVERGQYIIPRLDDGVSNTFRTKDGYIHADQAGYVYVGGASSYAIAGRRILTINGRLLGDYAGDMSILINSPDYRSRTFWGAFGKEDGSGTINGIAVRDNFVAVGGVTGRGRMFTGAERALNITGDNCDYEWRPSFAPRAEPFNLDMSGSSNPNNDSWMGVWFQDVWNYATCDSIQYFDSTCNVCDSIEIDSSLFARQAGFEANETVVCVGSPVTFTNTSVLDTMGHTWNFGAGASLLPGTTGEGPHTVTYSTPGLKTVRLNVILKDSQPDFEEKFQYINVLPANTTLSQVEGPDSVCAGAEVFFDVDPVFGVSYYEWDLPSDGQVLDGQGTRTIRASFFTSGGNVRVRGVYPCGTTPWIGKSVAVRTPNLNNALLVVGDSNAVLTAEDITFRNALINRGYSVTVMPDHAVNGSNAACAGLVVVSPTTDAPDLDFKLRNVPVPVLVMNPACFYFFSMTNGLAGSDYGTELGQSEIIMNDQTHEIGNLGFANTDPVEVYNPDGGVGWGKPGSNADVIYYVDGDPTKAAVFGYDVNETMKGFTATERRLGFYMDINGLINPGSEADSLFDLAICWLVRNCPTNLVITTDDVQNETFTPDLSYCVGDSIIIPFTVTGGSFNGSAPPPVQYPAYIQKVDNSDAGIFNGDGTRKFQTTGSGWTTVTYSSNPNPAENNTFLDDAENASEMKAIYRPRLFARGEYEVTIHVPGYEYPNPNQDSLNTGAVVTIIHEGGTTIRYVDQRNNKGWISVGSYDFGNSTDGRVIISNLFAGDTIHTIADAVQWTPIYLSPVGNTFTAQLSNSFGSFFSATTLGSVQNIISDTIYASIPTTVPTGNQYRVRIISSDPSVTASPNSNGNITITGMPQAPGPISGPTTGCQNISVNTYCVDPVPTASGSPMEYIWTRPLGTRFVGFPATAVQVRTTSNCVSVDFGTSTGGQITVRTANACTESDPISGLSSITVTLSGQPPVAPASIGGKDTVCNQDTLFYTVSPVFGANNYGWVLPAGVSVVGPDTNNNIVLEFDGVPNLTDITIGAYAINDCGNGDTTDFNVRVDNVSAAPNVGAITATPGSCSGQVTYNVTPINGVIDYNWTVPGTATILNGQSTNIIEVSYSSTTTGTVSVQATSNCGTGAQRDLAVNIVDTADVIVDLGTDRGICGPIILDAGDYQNYTWNTGQTTRTIVASNTGDYWVIVGDVNGCSASDTVNLFSSNAAIPTGIDDTAQLGPCGDVSVLVRATGSTGNYYWYEAATGGSPLDSASTFRLENISSDTSIFVSAWDYGNPQNSTYLNSGSDVRGEVFANMYCPGAMASNTVMTISAWVKCDNDGDVLQRPIWCTQDGDNFEGGMNMFGAGNGAVGFGLNTNGGQMYLAGTIPINDAAWHQVAITYDNGVGSLYIDGVLDATQTLGTSYSFSASNRSLRIGGGEVGDELLLLGGDAGKLMHDYTVGEHYTYPATTTENILGAHSTSQDCGIFVGTNGYLQWISYAGSNDYAMGENKASFTAPTAANLNDVFEYNRNGYVVGDNGTIWFFDRFPSNTFTDISAAGVTENLNGIHGDNNSNSWLYAVGDNGTILKSTNQGGSWTTQTSGTTENLNAVFVFNGTSGEDVIVVGDNGTILYTTDGGTNWTAATSGTTENLNDIHGGISDIVRAGVVGDAGTFLTTDDAGATWVDKTANTGTTENLNGVHCMQRGGGNERYAMVGMNGTHLMTWNFGSSFGNYSNAALGNLNAIIYERWINGNAWYGGIDELGFWTRALSAAEIADNYQNCINPLSQNLYAYFDFENNDVDQIGNFTCAVKGGSVSYSSVGGPVLACDKCESSRDTLSVTIDQEASDTLFTRDYAVCNTGDDITVSAFGGSGLYKWYRNPTGGTAFDTSSSNYQFTNITADSVVYVSTYSFSQFVPSEYFDAETTPGSSGNSDFKYIPIGDELTFECWVNTTNGSSNNGLMGNQSNAIEIEINNGNPEWMIQENGTGTRSRLTAASTVNDGTWHHLAFVFGNDSMYIYIDGELDTARAAGFTTFHIRDDNDANGFFDGNDRTRLAGGENTGAFTGKLDEIRIWTEAKTQSWISENMSKCVNATSANLHGYWKLDGNWNDETGGSTFGGPNSFSTIGANDLACGVCESERETINVELKSGNIFTEEIADSLVCQGSDITVPFSICRESEIAAYVQGGPTDVLDFDGVNDTILVPGYNGVTGSDIRSIEFWIKTSSTKSNNPIVRWGVSAAAEKFVVRLTNGFMRVEIGGGIYKESDIAINDGLWHYVSLVGTGTEMDDYFWRIDGNGQNGGSSNGTFNTSAVNDVVIGANFQANAGDRYFEGQLANFKIWSTDVQTPFRDDAMDSCLLGTYADLDLYYKIDEGAGGTVFDASTNGRDGTIAGATWIQDVGPTLVGCETQYNYYVELSDENGSFASPIVLGDTVHYSSTNAAIDLVGSITRTLPDSIVLGSGYKVRVVAFPDTGSGTVYTSDETPTTVEVPTNFWTGNLNNTWQNPLNWTCRVPTKDDDVTITSAAANQPIIYADSGDAFARNLTIATGASLEFTTGGGALNLFGNFTVDGTFTDQAQDGFLALSGETRQTLDGVTAIGSITLDNPNGAEIMNDIDLSADFQFQAGKFYLDDFDVDMCASIGDISGGSDSTYFVSKTSMTETNGAVLYTVPGDNIARWIPVGTDGSYTPARIRNSGASTCFRVRVFDGVYEHGMGASAGALITLGDSIVDKTWEITPTPATGAVADIMLQWNDGDERALFAADRYTGYIAKNIHSGTSPWVAVSTSIGSVTGATQPYRAEATGVTTFSNFIVANVFDPWPLPTELLAFNGFNLDGNGFLTWTATNEEGLAYYEVMKSVDNEQFEPIGQRKAKGNLIGREVYELIDEELEVRSYYKLRLVDTDGSEAFSETIAIDVDKKEAEEDIMIYPNPVSTHVNFRYRGQVNSQDKNVLEIVDATGRLVDHLEGNLVQLERMVNTRLPKLANGVYYLKFMDQSKDTFVHKMVVSKPNVN